MSDLVHVPEVVTGEVVELRSGPEANLFGVHDPVEVVARATAVATALKDVVRQQGLISNIQGREHPQVEAWTLLGSMLGVFPVVEWTRKTADGWEARVTAQTRAGEIVGAAEAECSRSERSWARRDDYAIRSMAQTRAISKALRAPLGFVMVLAGYSATPTEEMPEETSAAPPRSASSPSGAPAADTSSPPAVGGDSGGAGASPSADGPRPADGRSGSTAQHKAGCTNPGMTDVKPDGKPMPKGRLRCEGCGVTFPESEVS